MATSVAGIRVSTAVLLAMTSWTKGTDSHCESNNPPEPVMVTVAGRPPAASAASSNISEMVARMSLWWRR